MRSARRVVALVLVVVFNGLTGLASEVAGGARAQDPIDRIREADLKADLFRSPATRCAAARAARSTR